MKTLTDLIVLNTTKLNGDIFINFMLSTLVGELPGVFVLMITMKFFGRRLNLFSMQATLGICCVIMAFLAKTVSHLSMLLNILSYAESFSSWGTYVLRYIPIFFILHENKKCICKLTTSYQN